VQLRCIQTIIEPGICTRFNNPIFMEQTQLKDNFFSTQSKHGPSKRVTWKRAKTHNFPLKNIKNNKMWVVHHRNFNNQFFHWGKSILPFEWTVCVRYNWRYHFLNKVFGMLKTIKILASNSPTHAKTQNFSSKKK